MDGKRMPLHDQAGDSDSVLKRLLTSVLAAADPSRRPPSGRRLRSISKNPDPQAAVSVFCCRDSNSTWCKV